MVAVAEDNGILNTDSYLGMAIFTPTYGEMLDPDTNASNFRNLLGVKFIEITVGLCTAGKLTLS